MSHQQRVATALAVFALAAGIVACGDAATPQPSITPNVTPSAAVSTSTPSATPGWGQARWEPTGSMTTEHDNFHAHALNDGRVLLIDDDTTAEIWEPNTGKWHATSSLPFPRTGFASVVLHDGRVLVTGGLNDMGQSYSSAYLFNPVSESWDKVAGLMITARTNPSAAVLPDGQVLVAGGYFHNPAGSGLVPSGHVLAIHRPGTNSTDPEGAHDIVPGPFGPALATAEIFDPATGLWSATGAMRYARHGALAVTLADGRVLVAGALDYDTGVEVAADALDTAEIYDATTGQFTLTEPFPTVDVSEAEAAIGPLGGFVVGSVGQLVSTLDGSAVLIDHQGYWKHVGFASQSLHFDAASNAWREIGQTFVRAEHPVSGKEFATPGSPRLFPAVAALPDGRVLVAGGTLPDNRASAEAYDPATETWTPLRDMPEPRSQPRAVTVGDGSVLIIGGYRVEGDVAESLRSVVLLSFTS